MRTKLIYLSLILLIQLSLAFALGINHDQLKTFDATETLLKIDPATPDRLVFEGGDTQQVVLSKKNGHWTLPGHFKALADDVKVEELLKSLNALHRPWPTAENGSTDKRFKVADNHFERRLTLFKGEKELGRLLIGSSPGFRKVHARVGGEETVYDIPFSTYQVSLKPEDWVDKGQLRLKKAEISGIKLADCQLVRKDQQLQLEGLQKTEQTDPKKATELLDKLANLTILDVLAKPEQSLAGSTLSEILVSLTDGRQRSYQFIKTADGKKLQLQVSDQPYLYEVAPGLEDELTAYTQQSLVQPRPLDKKVADSTAAKKE